MAPPQKTDYNTVAIEDTAPQDEAASYGNEGRWLVVSEVITVVAARAWEFSVPLALLGPPGPHASLRAPAALALAMTRAGPAGPIKRAARRTPTRARPPP